MPYLITDNAEGCSGWATIKDDGEVMGCHTTKQDAIDQALAIAQAEGSEFLGERAMVAPDVFTTQQEAADRADEIGCEGTHSMDRDGNTVYMPCSTHDAYMDATGAGYRAQPDELELGDFVEWDSSGGVARGTIEQIIRDGRLDIPDSDFVVTGSEDDPAALIQVWRPNEVDGEVFWAPSGTLVGHKFSTLTKIDPLPMEQDEARQVNLDPPVYMRASARRGLEWHREGLSGDGLVDATIREARAMSEGNVTADKWVRIAAWIARHIEDLDAPAADPDHPDYPSPGVVAMALWGGGVTRRQANRTLEYANGVVRRIEAENEGRAKGEAVSKMETRVFEAPLELREDGDGMHLEGYAAIFNSRSENLGGFTEVIQPGAFGGSLRSRNDVKFLWNHDTGSVLGSTRAGTLTLTEDERGLKVSAILPNTNLGRDTRELVSRGDVTGFSFGFSMPARGGDMWSSDGTERTLKVVRLHEVSLVSFPAYPATNGTATVRGLEKVCERANVDADALADALLKMESGVDLNADDRAVVETVLGELSPKDEPVELDNNGSDILALKKAKLKLLMSEF